jgi:hypothetical protein
MGEATRLRYDALGMDDDEVRQAHSGWRPLFELLSRTMTAVEGNRTVATWSAVPVTVPLGTDTPQSGPETWIELEEVDGRSLAPFFQAMSVRDVADDALSETHGTRGPTIPILDVDREASRLLLGCLPQHELIEATPDTGQLRQQMEALKLLQNRPHVAHMGLLKLVQRLDPGAWDEPEGETPDLEWHVLDADGPGVNEQRAFVAKALATPDFAILEGPPGSGKTTVITELCLQLIEEGNRVLLCASTHVAVDNVLEHLVGEDNPLRDRIVALRIDAREKCSDAVRPLRLEQRAATEGGRIRDHLAGLGRPTLAQERFRDHITSVSSAAAKDLIVSVANVVGGTTFGLRQHPDLKTGAHPVGGPPFDVLIIDEASKTPIADFLVPAVRAKRWILVGDVRQLSPYVDANEVASILAAIINPTPWLGQMGLHMLQLRSDTKTRLAVIAAPHIAASYHQRAQALDISTTTDPDRIAAAALLLLEDGGVPPSDRTLSHSGWHVADLDDPAAAASAAGTWAEEVAWRLIARFEQRRSPARAESAIDRALDALVPVAPSRAAGGDIVEKLGETIKLVEDLAMPSIIEVLQEGLGRSSSYPPTVLRNGLPRDVLQSRHELLRFQRRMHPEISSFPRQHVYEGEALRDTPSISQDRAWSYDRYSARAMWLHVRGTEAGNANPMEVRAVKRELEAFITWASGPQGGDQDWEVAVISFYRAQVKALRTMLRRMSGDTTAYNSFTFGRVRVSLDTVDRFQGKEADVVLLSVAKTWTTSFTRSVNRVNVALTRARYQLVVIADHRGIGGSGPPNPLKALAEQVPMDVYVDRSR